MKYVEKIAVTEQTERKKAILESLDALGLDYEIKAFNAKEQTVENVVVSINPTPKRLVIGCHWDSVEGSTGANDNASGCSVALHLLELLKGTSHSIDVVFFGCEEIGCLGSEGYIKSLGRENIGAMVNLDVCGHGEHIVAADKGNKGDPAFYSILGESVLRKHRVKLSGFMPHGDDDSFTAAGIANISVCCLVREDMELFRKIGKRLKEGKKPTANDQKRFGSLDIMATMHGGEKDNISAATQESIDRVVNWLYDGLR